MTTTLEKTIETNAPVLRRQVALRNRISRKARGLLAIGWSVEMWPTIDEDIPSSVLRADPKCYGRPVAIDDPSQLLQRLQPHNIAARIVGFDEPPDPNWLDKRYAEILGISLDDARVAIAFQAGMNLVTDVGENLVCDLIRQTASTTGLTNAAAYLGVSSNSTAAAESDTSIPSATWVAMNATHPVDPTGSSLTLQSDFGSGIGNHAWNRWGIANGSNPGTTGILFSNKTETLGTKSGGVWTLTATLSVD